MPHATSVPSGDSFLGQPVALVLTLAMVSLLPFLFMSVTAFVKISTVLQITRGAIGAQGVPSNTVVMALAAALTLLAMAPTTQKIADRSGPLVAIIRGGDATAIVGAASETLGPPLREFLEHNASEKERQRFFRLSEGRRGALAATPHDFSVIIPAFVVTELGEAFAIGVLIFLPFLVIDLVVSNVLLALGMQMLTPTQVSLPFKLLLFVAIDGWGLLSQALVTSYR